jgi:hypothetical protein
MAYVKRAVSNALSGPHAITDAQRAELARFILIGGAR